MEKKTNKAKLEIFKFLRKPAELWPRGVVVSALTSHVRDPRFDSRAGQLPQASFFTLIAYVDPALIGYLDVRRLVSRILGTWRRCGMEDNVSYVHGLAQPVVIIHHPHVSTASVSKGWGVQRDVQAYLHLQPVPCLSRSCVGGEGHGRLVYLIYLVYRGLCHLVQQTCPMSCRSLVTFNLLTFIAFDKISRNCTFYGNSIDIHLLGYFCMQNSYLP